MAELPTGVVTFLFTDIEGSTRLLGQQPQAYAAALLRHDALMRAAVAKHGGVIFETVGDAVYAAFGSPLDAVHSALAAQLHLQAEPWGELGQLKARMALHTGPVQRRGDHYFGTPLYRCARLMAIGHGAQTLLSGVTAEAVREALSAPASLRRMGRHRLKDLAELEVVFQLVHPDLAADFPALKSLDPRRTNLPHQTTSFVGRQNERTELMRMLGAGRLVTLTGPGGIGKTRLGLQAAADLLPEFDDGVFFVSLSPIRDSGLVAPAIAKVLGVQEELREPVAQTLSKHLRSKELLLMLDNFEQVADAAPLVADLLSACQKLKVLVTSRASLHLSMEQQLAVPPLPRSAASGEAADPSPAPRSDAVVLFIERALAVNSQFPVTEVNLSVITEICERLEGLPLSIELAAARSKLLSPQAMLPLLGSRLKLLTGGPHDRPDRQASVRAAIEWSHDLLSIEEQRLFARLGVFAGGFSLDAAESTCEADLDGLASLLDMSLIRRENERFSMLETVREFALERLEALDAQEPLTSHVLRQRHAEHFARAAQAANDAMAHDMAPLSADPMRSTDDVIYADLDNHRAALAWTISVGNGRLAVGHLRSLEDYQRSRGRRAGHDWPARFSHRSWLEKILSLDGLAERSRDRLWTIGMLGEIAVLQADFPLAQRALDEALSLAREWGDPTAENEALTLLGETAHYQGDLDRAQRLFEEALAVSRRGGLPLAEDLHNLGAMRRDRGDLEGAAALLEEALVLGGYVPTQLILAECEQLRGNRERAGRLILDAYERERASRSMWSAFAPMVLAWWYVEADDAERAAPYLRTALRLADELDIKVMVRMGLEISAAIVSLNGDHIAANEFHGAADALAAANNIAPWVPHAEMLLRTRARVDAAIGKDVGAAAYQRGHSLPTSIIVERALATVAS
jgi:predicted ATPase/class 3 adenylate cyclase